MKITLDELKEQLIELEYPMTKRRLIDWMQKGLLPPLEKHGLGKGKGSVNYWSHPGILGQAITVCELLAWYGRVDGIILILWLAGYDVPEEIVRKKLLDYLDKLIDKVNNPPAGVHIEDHRSDLIYNLLDNPVHGYSNLYEIIEVILKCFFNEDYDISKIDYSELSMNYEDGSESQYDKYAATLIQNNAHVIRKYLTFEKLRAVIAKSSDEEIKTVHQDIISLVQSFRNFMSIMMNRDDAKVYERGMINAFGYWIALVIFSFRHYGHGKIVDDKIKNISQFSNRFVSDEEILREVKKRFPTIT